MQPNNGFLTPVQKKILKGSAVIGAVWVSFFAGMALSRALDDENRTPFMLENAYVKAQEDLIDRAKIAFLGDDLAKLSFISGLRQAGVAKAYNVEIDTLRDNAFAATMENKDIEAIQAIDTRMADQLLFDAIQRLGDEDLFQVLNINRGIFLTEARASMLSDTEATDKGLRYYNLYHSHSTLSEQERDQLSGCFNKLKEKLDKQKDKTLMFDNGSGTCLPVVEPKKVKLFSPRRFLQNQ
jgi:hypothetical protein